MNASWVIDELAHAGPEHLDPDFVAGFDRKQGHPAFDEDLDVLRQRGALSRDSIVVDLGTGTGRFALAAAPHCARVVAVDVSPAMLEHVHRSAAAAGASNVDVVRAGFLTYDHVGEPADAIYSRNSLHQLPDFWKGIALHRAAEILRPGGVLRLHDLVYDIHPADASIVLQGWMDAAWADPATGYTAEDCATHLRTEFSTFRWLLEPLLEVAGFDIVQAEYRQRVYATYTCLRH